MSNYYTEARRYLAGGVNSPVRAFAAVGGEPVFMARARGAYLYTEDGKRLIDYVGSWGPMILGHADPDVIEAVCETAQRGLSFGAPTLLETRLARLLCEMIPSLERVRLVNSGTEATMSAIRLARGYTNRDHIIKFTGCYHGHADALLVKAGSGALTFGVPTSPGIPKAFAEQTMTVDFNDVERVREVFAHHGDSIACVIVEPVAGNMNFVQPVDGFLQTLRELCTEHGSVLIFDEVMTGFRVARGGAQEHYGVTPDLTTLGKIIGGGMPVGAFGGRADIMAQLAPDGPVYQAGTLSGNPVAMAAGLATLEKLQSRDFYTRLDAATKRLVDGLLEVSEEAEIAFWADHLGGMFGFFFSAERPIRFHRQVTACDQERFRKFFHGMLDAGVYLAPSAFEAGFVSAAHSDEDIEQTLSAAGRVMQSL